MSGFSLFKEESKQLDMRLLDYRVQGLERLDVSSLTSMYAASMRLGFRV